MKLMKYSGAEIGMNGHSLQLFLHLARTLHYGRTSRECHVSPSTLSRAIQRLEQEAEVTLFDRGPRSVTLTEAGARFREYAAESLERWAEFRRTTKKSDRQLSGPLTIFCTVTATHSLLPTVMRDFREAHPGVKIRLATGYAAAALGMLDEVDLTIAAVPQKLPRGVLRRVLTHTALRFVAPSTDCAVSREVERRPLVWSRVPIVMPEFGLARVAVDAWFDRQGIYPEIYSEVAGSEATLALVAMGCGVGAVPQMVIERSAMHEKVRVLNEVEVGPSELGIFTVAACVRKKTLENPVVAAFWQAVGRAEI